MRGVGRWVLLCALGATPASAVAEQATSTSGRKQASAAQVPGGAIRVDGRLDEEAWLRATPITDYI